MTKKHVRIGAIGTALGLITFGAFTLANSLTVDSALYQFLQSAGFGGIVLLGVFSGINPIIPVPPATFAPLFIASGFSIPTIVAGFVIGTTIADSLVYALGWFGKQYTDTTYPKLTERIHTFLQRHSHFVMPAAFAYFALAPLPNEFILIPLALSGYAYRKLLIPIILGNIVHHTILVVGYDRVFQYFF